jgi:hypothetical protein
MKKIDYEVWLEANSNTLNNVMGHIFKSLHKLTVPAGLDFEFDYEDSMKEQILKYMYDNSSSAIRKQ